MKHIDKYYELLEVPPGSGADVVKKAFRTKIKAHHPDTGNSRNGEEYARNLIEAYHVLKKGPPAGYSSSRTAKSTRREGVGQKREERYARPFTGFKGTTRRHAPHAGNGDNFHDFAREAGERMYDNIFSGSTGKKDSDKERGRPDIGHYWEELLARMLDGEFEEADIFGSRVRVREYVHESTADDGNSDFYKPDIAATSSDPNALYFKRAEILLRETVRKYDVGNALKRKLWVKEYLAKLNNILILFRDVANRSPALSVKALYRIKQIKELSGEIRQML